MSYLLNLALAVPEREDHWHRLGTGYRGNRSTCLTWYRYEGSRVIYNVTLCMPPAANDGGYFNLRAILRLRGIVQHDFIGSCHGARAD